MSELKVMMLHETILESWGRDAVTFGLLAVLPWLNFNYLGASGWIYAAISFAWFISLFARISSNAQNNRMTPEEARQWLDEKFPQGQSQ